MTLLTLENQFNPVKHKKATEPIHFVDIEVEHLAAKERGIFIRSWWKPKQTKRRVNIGL